MLSPKDFEQFDEYAVVYEDEKGEKPSPFYMVSKCAKEHALSDGCQTEQEAINKMKEQCKRGDNLWAKVVDWKLNEIHCS